MDQAMDWLIDLECANAEQRAAFDAWLAADPANREAFARAQAIWNSDPLIQVAAALPVRKPSLGQRLGPHCKPLAIAAVLLLSLTSFSNLPLRLQADHLTVVGERQRLQLDDGSNVLLNTNSAFSSEINDRHRVARLYQGEAFFDIATNHKQPLEIDAGPVRMNADNSAFAVRYLDGVAQILVQRGNLDLQAVPDSSHINLSAGDSIRVGPQGFGQREKLNANKDLAWVQGRLVFENSPLGDVLSELRRYYPGWIVTTNRHLETVAVTGNYRLDSPVDVVRSLANITSAHLHELPDLMILN
ncbi:FecR family protein [Pseudomonas sp. NA-150]|uniref:FecR family protein n=1 Tax=Pseudomonas sp. NA-150 TaxID=3367525 RepID=UPI0037C9275E